MLDSPLPNPRHLGIFTSVSVYSDGRGGVAPSRVFMSQRDRGRNLGCCLNGPHDRRVTSREERWSGITLVPKGHQGT